MREIDVRVRCPHCRGSKVVAKLGGIMGECNTCVGVGTIKESDKHVPAPIIDCETAKRSADIIEAVSRAVPVSVDVADKVKAVNDDVVKISKGTKRAVFKRKQG